MATKNKNKKTTVRKKKTVRDNEPINKRLYAIVKKEAMQKYKVYPSLYANAWLVKTYKERGGTYANKKSKGKLNTGIKKYEAQK